MEHADDVALDIAHTDDWNVRVAKIRTIPERYGIAHHQAMFSSIARHAYVPQLAPDFAYVHWTEDYELSTVEASYAAAYAATDGFNDIDEQSLSRVLRDRPESLRAFRLLLGFTWSELADTAAGMAEEFEVRPPGKEMLKGVERGRVPTSGHAGLLAAVIHRAMTGDLFPNIPGARRRKLDKPDTMQGWDGVRYFAQHGVPLPVLLHQRHYGGAFRQLLDATSSRRGDVLEDAVEALFVDTGVPYIRTGSDNQAEIARRFGLTVRPAPDFVLCDSGGVLRGMLECKAANDGGTARDKAARFTALRREATRLGGVPLFAVVAGLGWRRTMDALGPVVRDTDGRTFTLASLQDILEVEPLPLLVGTLQSASLSRPEIDH